MRRALQAVYMTAPLPCVKSTEKALAPAGRSIHVAL